MNLQRWLWKSIWQNESGNARNSRHFLFDQLDTWVCVQDEFKHYNSKALNIKLGEMSWQTWRLIDLSDGLVSMDFLTPVLKVSAHGAHDQSKLD